jgi:septin 7
MLIHSCRLHQRVNIIPVIAKADTMTDEEIQIFKQRILDDIEHHGIRIYKPKLYDGDDEESIMETKDIITHLPFAVVGSTTDIKTSDGRVVRGRQYPWGVIEGTPKYISTNLVN